MLNTDFYLRSLAESADELTRSLQDFAEVLTRSGFLTVVSRMNEDLKLYNRLLVDLEHIGLHVTSYILEKITSIEKLFSKNEKDLSVIDKINGQQVLFANAAILALEAARFKTEVLIGGDCENNTKDELSEQNNTDYQTDENIITNDITELNTENQTIISDSSTVSGGFTEDTTAINPDNMAGVTNATDIDQDQSENENDTLITTTVETVETEFSGDNTAQVTTAAVTEEISFEDEMRKMKRNILKRNEEARITEHVVPNINNEPYEDVDETLKEDTDTIGGFLVEHQADNQRRQQNSAEQIENFVSMELAQEGSGDGLLEGALINDNVIIDDDNLAAVEGSGGDDDHMDFMTMEDYMIIP